MQQTADGGYIIGGSFSPTDSFGWTGTVDGLLIKTDSNGYEEWSRTYGGNNTDHIYSVKQTNDGGYVMTGRTSSFGNGSADVWLIKTDNIGNELWNKTIGGNSFDEGKFVDNTFDEGYVITGRTSSFGNGSADVWLIKTDNVGNELWNKTFGGTDSDVGNSVQPTNDGGYIITGYSYSIGGGSLWIIKTDSEGNEEWNNDFGGDCEDQGYSGQQTYDGGYIITGSFMFDCNDYRSHPWVIKTDSFGNEIWSKTFNGVFEGRGYSVQQTNDGGYIMAGTKTDPERDVLLIRIDNNGNKMWSQIFSGSNSDNGYSLDQTTDGGYILTGNTSSFGNGISDVWLIKTDENGDVWECNDILATNYTGEVFGSTQTYCEYLECSENLGDINNDSSINMLDIVILANCLLANNCDECSDINADATYNILDIVSLVNIILNP